MITLERAKDICKNKYSEYLINEIIDIGDSWAFCFDSGNPPVPNVPIITVQKENGKTAIMTIPPFENIELLNKGIVVK